MNQSKPISWPIFCLNQLIKLLTFFSGQAILLRGRAESSLLHLAPWSKSNIPLLCKLYQLTAPHTSSLQIPQMVSSSCWKIPILPFTLQFCIPIPLDFTTFFQRCPLMASTEHGLCMSYNALPHPCALCCSI